MAWPLRRDFTGLCCVVCSSLLKRTTTCQNELIVQLLALVRTFLVVQADCWQCAVTRARQPRRSRSPCTVEL